MFRQSIYKAGNSLCISIPSRLVKKFGIEAGQSAQVDVLWEDCTLKVHFPEAHQLSLLNKRK